MPDDWKLGGFGLYVHWPFCVSKCPYCDFNSHVSSSIDQGEWTHAFLKVIDNYALETPDRELNSIYFGGGTPSLMHPLLVEKIINRAQQKWRFSNDIEITLEANPTSVEVGKFEAFRLAGVNRVSIGIQALNDIDLRRLGRMHNTSEALRALEIARGIFDRISFDLIYARQDQSVNDWEFELKSALDLSPDHLSLYQLTIEPGTVFGARHQAGKLVGLPDEDNSADMFEITQLLCNTNGLPAYEVSNHARKGMESRHNMVYWNAGDYIGIGPGAHGRITTERGRFATETPLEPNTWLKNTQANTTGESLRSRLLASEQTSEYIIMGLRTSTGVSLQRLKAMGGTLPRQSKINELVSLGMIVVVDNHLIATLKGRPILNELIRELAPD